MNVIPATDAARIEFALLHAQAWMQDPEALGITLAEAEMLKSLGESAAAAAEAARLAREAAKAATLTLRARLDALHAASGYLVRKIKAHAEYQPVPSTVYAEALIPVPAAKAALPPPGRPEIERAAIEPGGGVTLRWRATSAASSTGALFTVLRKLPGEDEYTPVGSTAGTTAHQRSMRFTDARVPLSALAGGGVSYLIRGSRGGREGEPSVAVHVDVGGAAPVAAGEGASRVRATRIAGA